MHSIIKFFIYSIILLPLTLFCGCDRQKSATKVAPLHDRTTTLRPPWTRCDERDGFMRYLKTIAYKTKQIWKIPALKSEIDPPYTVYIAFSINADGSLRDSSVSGHVDAGLMESALTAFRTAQPLIDFPDNLQCISNMEGLAITITHPSSPE